MSVAYSLIFPAYNEADNLEKAVRETAAVFNPLPGEYEILIVDDGSTDATAGVGERLARESASVRLLRHAGNRGKGRAVQTGVAAAAGEKIFFLDCDLATHPREALAFLAAAEEADVVIASRRVAGAAIKKAQRWYRSFFGRVINLVVRLFFKLPQHDTQCGFKMFKAASAKTIFRDLGPTRWLFDVEILMRAQNAGYTVKELPVAWTNGAGSRVRIRHVLSDFNYLWKLRRSLKKK